MKKLLTLSVLVLSFAFATTASAANLLTNGGFEYPILGGGWAVFPDGYSGLGWDVSIYDSAWYNPSRPGPELEIQTNGVVPPVVAYEGNQYAELDSYGSILISEDIETSVGCEYTLSYAWTPRPGVAVNNLKVYVNGTEVPSLARTVSGIGSTGVWTPETYTFTATLGTTNVGFSEGEPSDQLGMFLDKVSLELVGCEICPEGYVQEETPIQNLTVPSTTPAGNSSSPLLSGFYVLEVSGTWYNRGGTETGDAEYYSKNNWVTWTDGYNYPDYNLGLGFGDLQVDESFVDWGSYSSTHEYSIAYTGTGSAVNFRIFDGDSNAIPPEPNSGWYGDNSDSLNVDIYRCACAVDADEDGYCQINDCDDNNAAIHPGAEETCNGLDDDCDAAVDEDLTAPLANNQNGVCAGSVKVCDGVNGWKEPTYSALPYYEPVETRCDTLDNDCDATVDENGICEYSCIGTPPADSPDVELGVNRWIWNGSSWVTNAPKGKGPSFTPTQAGTHNCSCEQILTWLHNNLPETYGEMNGHWKYGCSQSVIQEFMALADESSAFTASASLYYNGPTDGYPLYGLGPIAFTWNPYTGQVTGGYYKETVPAYSTTYYNLITDGTVNGNNVYLVFDRTNPDIYHFTFDGTLIGNVLSGYMDGPYLFIATGVVTP